MPGTTTRIAMIAAVSVLAMSAAIGWAQIFSEQQVLTPHVIMRADAQLTREADISSYEDFEYVHSVRDCRELVSRQIEIWMSNHGLTPAARSVELKRVRISIPFLDPSSGNLVFVYRLASDENTASINVLFDSNEKLNPEALQEFAINLNLVSLKSKLVKAMKCTYE